MRAYSVQKARHIAATFNASLSIDETARALHIPKQDVRQIVTWLWDFAEAHASDHDTPTPGCVGLPTGKVWLMCLYEHGIRLETAAACVNWPVERARELFGAEWAKEVRKPAFQRKLKLNDFPAPNDPSPADIAIAKEMLKAGCKPEELAIALGHDKPKNKEEPADAL